MVLVDTGVWAGDTKLLGCLKDVAEEGAGLLWRPAGLQLPCRARASKAGAKSGRQCSGGSLGLKCTAVSDLFVNK